MDSIVLRRSKEPGPASKLARPGICHAFVFGKIQGLGLLNFDKNIRDSRERRYKLIDTKFDRPKFLPDRAFFKNALQLLNFLSTKKIFVVYHGILLQRRRTIHLSGPSSTRRRTFSSGAPRKSISHTHSKYELTSRRSRRILRYQEV